MPSLFKVKAGVTGFRLPSIWAKAVPMHGAGGVAKDRVLMVVSTAAARHIVSDVTVWLSSPAAGCDRDEQLCRVWDNR